MIFVIAVAKMAISTSCTAPENSSEVIKRLIRSMQKLQQGQRGIPVCFPEQKEKGGQVTRSIVGPHQATHIPQVLIGKPTVRKLII